MLVLDVAVLQRQRGQRGRAAAQQFVEAGGKGAKEVVAADVQANQRLAVEAVAEVCHVHAVQRAVGQIQALQRGVEWTGWRNNTGDDKLVLVCRSKMWKFSISNKKRISENEIKFYFYITFYIFEMQPKVLDNNKLNPPLSQTYTGCQLSNPTIETVIRLD